jgi:hypothetical protein
MRNIKPYVLSKILADKSTYLNIKILPILSCKSEKLSQIKIKKI